MSQPLRFPSRLRKGAYPTDVPPGIRGLKSKMGVLGLVLVLAPGAILLTLAVQKLGGMTHRISSLNMGRGIGACGIFMFYGYLCLKTAITGEDFKGQRERVAREEAELLRQQRWHEKKNSKQA